MNKKLLSLVGAGPGNTDLITLKAVKTLEKAAVVLYDALANDELLKYVSSGAITRFVGKRYGCHALSQQEINTLIVEYANRYGHVVRLKGGDPFVFGRAQEEIDAARAAGIEVEIVPGISSAIAVPALQMIPLTCRGITESFWVCTGTTRSGDISNDILLAAQSTATVVILMAMSRLEAIMDIFTAFGKKDTPVAVIENGSTDKERIVMGTVQDIYFKTQYAGMGNPSVIVVGEVVKLHPSLNAEKIAGFTVHQFQHAVIESRTKLL
ncbi:MAG TPA: uroporphyrinogen-III C-methyltransferase [Ferruginibacter sp.]|nr:uroporphyrinogen-III C-methyltransferase [Ferruginibacter sp.]HMP20145.1 uroporphyrinogen-III C-methyltransferase [Ferruginibacter sp.]